MKKTNTDLSGTDLSGTDLRGANLMEADLSGANLTGANLSGADLMGASLEGANMLCADLDGAKFAYANLAGANLTGANLVNADLSNAYHVPCTDTKKPPEEQAGVWYIYPVLLPHFNGGIGCLCQASYSLKDAFQGISFQGVFTAEDARVAVLCSDVVKDEPWERDVEVVNSTFIYTTGSGIACSIRKCKSGWEVSMLVPPGGSLERAALTTGWQKKEKPRQRWWRRGVK